jgi:hypothetical protein
MTPRIGRLRVREHCSFFWAEGPFRRVVAREPAHCSDCVEALRVQTEADGLTFDYGDVDGRTLELLRASDGMRKNARIPCMIPVEIQESPALQPEWALCRSLSRGGLLITGPRLHRGEEVEVSLTVPGVDEFRASGRVVYTIEAPEGPSSGVAFTSLAPAIGERLEAYVQTRMGSTGSDPSTGLR